MANYFVGEFAMNVGLGNQSIVGVGFKPKLVIVFANRLIDGETSLAQNHFEFGAADADLNQFGLSIASQDAVTTSQSGRISSAVSFIIIPDGANTPRVIGAEADLISMDDDGFTIDITNAPPRAYGISFIAIGGQDFQVTVGNVAAAALGSQAITGVGFQPDALIAATIFVVGATADNDHAVIGLGWADQDLNQNSISVQSQDALGDSNTNRRQILDKTLCALTATGASQMTMETTSYDTDGFTVNFTDTNPNNGRLFYIAMQGIPTRVGAFNSRTAVEEFSINGVGFRPGVGMFASFLNPSSASTQTSAKMSFGAAQSPTSRGSRGLTDEDAQGITDADQFRSDDMIYQNYDFTRTLLGEIDFVSWDGDGFTLDEVDADTAANEILYMVFKDVDEADAPTEILRTRSIPLAIPSSASPEARYNPPQQQTLSRVADLESKFQELLDGSPRFLTLGDDQPDQITANQDNYIPGDNTVLWLTADAARTITGIAQGSRGRVLVLVNVGAQTIQINNDDASSDAANRILTNTAGNMTLAANDWALLIYNINENRWRAMDL